MFCKINYSNCKFIVKVLGSLSYVYENIIVFRGNNEFDFDFVCYDFNNIFLVIWLVVGIVFIFLIFFMGNIMVVIVVYRGWRMKIIVNFLIVNMVVLDFLNIIFVVLKSIICIFIYLEVWFIIGEMGDVLCRIVYFL